MNILLLRLPYFIILFTFLSLFLTPSVFSQTKKLQADRITYPPKIDGILNNDIWQNHENVSRDYFFQSVPENGVPSDLVTEVQVLYNDFSIYVSARMYDPDPANIPAELGIRDDLGRNADYFGIYLDPWNNDQNAFNFIVSVAGVQTDQYITPEGRDRNWDAVWVSEVSIDEDGWVVEMEIPLSALRFPNADVQTWGLNFIRRSARLGETSFWNLVDNSINGLVNQFGELHGLSGIDPPTRLFFMPFLTAIAGETGSPDGSSLAFTGGMDVKYGINESFTLDLSLVPDFSQVRADNVVLNLSPFEVRFAENRPFFMEGTELFDKGNLFYSRRVGQSFGNIDHLEQSLNEGEEIISSPIQAPLLNAVKISGRTNKGTGLGFFNAVTNETVALIRNPETNQIREERIDPVTNFNVVVIDQNLKNNSNIGFINTNVTRANGGNNANVTGTEFRFFDKYNRYRLSGFGAVSNIMMKNRQGNYSSDVGYRYNLFFSKVSGKYRFSLGRNVESDNYNPNDLGFIRNPNEISHRANVSYNVFQPFWKLLRFNVQAGFRQQMVYEPRTLNRYNFNTSSYLRFKNFWELRLNYSTTPWTTYDYFEAREPGRVFNRPSSFDTNFWLRTDNRKKFAVTTSAGYWKRPSWNNWNNWMQISPRMRVNDHFSLFYTLSLSFNHSQRGYATTLWNQQSEEDDIIFGLRNLQTVTNSLTGSYIFNNKMGLNLRVRHYWSKVKYDRFYQLDVLGNLQDSPYTGFDETGIPLHDTNFNAFNLELGFSWQIAPGSFLNIMWQDALHLDNHHINMNFMENFNNVIQSRHAHTISLKLTYFIDYQNLKKFSFKDLFNKNNDNQLPMEQDYITRSF